LTIKRFFLLQEFIEKTGSCDVLHVESDVILMPNFPFKTFTGLECDLAFPMVDAQHAAASVMYIKNHEAIESFINFIDSEKLRHDDTDMRILVKYAKENSNVCILPSRIESEISGEGRKSVFEGVFDGATYGQYLFGLDPRNNLGRRTLFQPLSNHHVKAHNYSYEVTIINQRYGLQVSSKNGQKYPIYNLHIHSKDLRAFMIKLDEPAFLNHRCKQASAGKIKVEFVPMIFLRELPSILKYIPHIVLKVLKSRSKS
jgi:hypothetical protein